MTNHHNLEGQVLVHGSNKCRCPGPNPTPCTRRGNCAKLGFVVCVAVRHTVWIGSVTTWGWFCCHRLTRHVFSRRVGRLHVRITATLGRVPCGVGTETHDVQSGDGPADDNHHSSYGNQHSNLCIMISVEVTVVQP